MGNCASTVERGDFGIIMQVNIDNTNLLEALKGKKDPTEAEMREADPQKQLSRLGNLSGLGEPT